MKGRGGVRGHGGVAYAHLAGGVQKVPLIGGQIHFRSLTTSLVS